MTLRAKKTSTAPPDAHSSSPSAPGPKSAYSTPATPQSPATPQTLAQPLPSRRRPSLIALGIALIAVCAVGAWWIANQLSATEKVVVSTHDIAWGQTITRKDLAETTVNLPPGVKRVEASSLTSLIGRHATSTIPRGSILSPSQVSATDLPEAGKAIISIEFNSAQVPVDSIVPGDKICLLSTPRPNSDPVSDSPDSSTDSQIDATVLRVGSASPRGTIAIQVIVSSQDIHAVTSLSASGRIGLAVMSREK
ncbi:SAF domain-containing protein [Devriesea agamarum]|uniref:SAF domain-containing protein n=1 Tax=Devriesea agamarum TaxID=472569 RepID=UPI00071D8F0C|nr:SAF domain-containing protein [Devriesea agamarum]